MTTREKASFTWKHLHGRGEDWRSPGMGEKAIRNTSTDVEKTARFGIKSL